MAIAERTEKYAKEIDEVMVLIVDTVKQVKAGVPLQEIALSQIQNALNALSNVDQVPEEFGQNLEVALRTIMARAAELAAALVQPAQVVKTVEVAAVPTDAIPPATA